MIESKQEAKRPSIEEAKRQLKEAAKVGLDPGEGRRKPCSAAPSAYALPAASAAAALAACAAAAARALLPCLPG